MRFAHLRRPGGGFCRRPIRWAVVDRALGTPDRRWCARGGWPGWDRHRLLRWLWRGQRCRRWLGRGQRCHRWWWRWRRHGLGRGQRCHRWRWRGRQCCLGRRWFRAFGSRIGHGGARGFEHKLEACFRGNGERPRGVPKQEKRYRDMGQHRQGERQGGPFCCAAAATYACFGVEAAGPG